MRRQARKQRKGELRGQSHQGRQQEEGRQELSQRAQQEGQRTQVQAQRSQQQGQGRQVKRRGSTRLASSPSGGDFEQGRARARQAHAEAGHIGREAPAKTGACGSPSGGAATGRKRESVAVAPQNCPAVPLSPVLPTNATPRPTARRPVPAVAPPAPPTTRVVAATASSLGGRKRQSWELVSGGEGASSSKSSRRRQSSGAMVVQAPPSFSLHGRGTTGGAGGGEASAGGGAGAEGEGEGPAVIVVTDPAQLPKLFLDPPLSVEDEAYAVGFDCEGVELSRDGCLCVMQVALGGVVYLIDALEGGPSLVEACRPALESPAVIKVIHDCRRDAEALFFQFGIKVQGVFDIQLAHFLIDGSTESENVSFVQLLALPQYCGAEYAEKRGMRQTLINNPEFWRLRPWTEPMLKLASEDVRYLPLVHARMLPLLSPTLLHSLAVRSALRARSFCCSSTQDTLDLFPPPLPYPSLLALGPGFASSTLSGRGRPSVRGHAPTGGESVEQAEGVEEEISLSVVQVPPGKLGYVIGKKGTSIKGIRQACAKCEIFTGGQKGPENKLSSKMAAGIRACPSEFSSYFRERIIRSAATCHEVVRFCCSLVR